MRWFDLHGVVRYAVFKTLQVVGALVFIGAGAAAFWSWWTKPDTECLRPNLSCDGCYMDEKQVMATMDEGTCKLLVKIYGTNESMTLSSGVCLYTMGVLRGALEAKPGEDL